MKRNNTLLIVSAGFLIVAVLVLTQMGLNDNTQIVDESAPSAGDSSTSQAQTHNHSHPSPEDIIFQSINRGEDTAAKRVAIQNALSANASTEDFEKLLGLCSEQDSPIIYFCRANIALNSENWTAFEENIKAYVGDDIHDELVIQTVEPMLKKATEHEQNPLYLNMLADVYMHDEQNMQGFMTGIRTLKQVLELDSNNEEAIYKLAISSVRSNQLEKAKQRFKKLISLQPENEGYRRMLEELCKKTNDPDCQ